jgi:hypothetical protein
MENLQSLYETNMGLWRQSSMPYYLLRSFIIAGLQDFLKKEDADGIYCAMDLMEMFGSFDNLSKLTEKLCKEKKIPAGTIG